MTPPASAALDPVGRARVVVAGLVQGVGFRPFVYRLAERLELSGLVRNELGGVVVEVEGRAVDVDRFITALGTEAPATARAARVTVVPVRPRFEPGFRIEPATQDGEIALYPAPDLATCAACVRELEDAGGRRHRYALLTCTDCGPRFTVLSGVPWARAHTTMARFPLCGRCRDEYADPRDRRFHAETTACPACGPSVVLRDARGDARDVQDPIAAAAGALRAGGIVAVKGIGGYHLACDATNPDTIARLRRRKRRDAKPFAVMLADLDAVRALCRVSAEEADLLAAPARPIVLLARRHDAPSRLADGVAPGLAELGVMLPYTPLHHLLIRASGGALVMTSGNASDEPIAHDDDDARRRLGSIADHWLAHDRPIAAWCDDSVARVVRGAPVLLRRSRGYVPLPVRLPVSAPVPLLACGGELKSAFALVRGTDAFVGQHCGDLGDARAWRAYVDALAHLGRLLGIVPAAVVHDLHPGYRTTRYAESLAGVERVGVQHHHAHVASCLADNGVDRPVIGVAWDGTGYGPDGHVWGGEFLVADLAGFERAAHLEEVPLPGGETAIREPWRMMGAFLTAAYGAALADVPSDLVHRLEARRWPMLARALAAGPTPPLTSSVGRLFDAVACLLGIRDVGQFEAQAAMELEAVAAPRADRVYPVRVVDGDGPLVVRTTDVIRAVVDDLRAAVAAPVIAARFHATLVDVIVRVAERLRTRTGLTDVVLTGGVFQNARLLDAAIGSLERAGFLAYRHRDVPPNDGGLAVGQAAVAARRLARSGAR